MEEIIRLLIEHTVLPFPTGIASAGRRDCSKEAVISTVRIDTASPLVVAEPAVALIRREVLSVVKRQVPAHRLVIQLVRRLDVEKVLDSAIIALG